MNAENSSGSKKKKAAASAIAVVLALTFAISGTLSYDSGATASASNVYDGVFAVSLTESDVDETDADGNTTKYYEILPGTTDAKDPTVMLAAIVDAYVFLVVEDSTDGMVEYDILDDWEILVESDEDEESGVTTTIYYQKVDAETNDSGDYLVHTLGVLEDDQISYPSSVTADEEYKTETATNDDGETETVIKLENSNKLVFYAYAIQSEGFDTALSAYYAAVYGVPEATVTEASSTSAVTLLQYLGSSTTIGTITPDITFSFTATDSATEAASSEYASWYVDFYVTFDVTDADTSDWNGYVAIAGQYASYSNYWVPIILQAYNSSNGSIYSGNLCLDEIGTGKWLTYSTLVSVVGTFNCGTVQEVTSSNTTGTVYTLATSSPYYGISVPDGVVMTVELRLYKDVSGSSSAGFTYGDTYITVAKYEYTYGED